MREEQILNRRQLVFADSVPGPAQARIGKPIGENQHARQDEEHGYVEAPWLRRGEARDALAEDIDLKGQAGPVDA